MKADKGVTHWCDGSSTWKLGLGGFFLRVRGHLVQIAVGLPLMGVPFWWPAKWPNHWSKQLSFSVGELTSYATGATFAIIFALFVYLRHRTVKSLRVKSILHRISHETRDSLSHVYEVTQPKPGKRAKGEGALHQRHLFGISDRLCALIAEYFEAITGDSSVGCAIRLGVDLPGDGKCKVEYVTVGRSARLNASRGVSSDAIPSNVGIPAFFASDERACQGVLFYTDIKEAARNQAYHLTRNDSLFPDDFTAMMVAPLNEVRSNRRLLIGLLCVTSKSGAALKSKHIDLFKFLADLLAQYYISHLSRVEFAASKANLTAGNGDESLK